MLIKINKNKTTEFPYTLDRLRKDNPNQSFPDSIVDSTTVRIYGDAVASLPDARVLSSYDNKF
jgi:hypothetical protein